MKWMVKKNSKNIIYDGRLGYDMITKLGGSTDWKWDDAYAFTHYIIIPQFFLLFSKFLSNNKAKLRLKLLAEAEILKS